jgi:hypothetical protein
VKDFLRFYITTSRPQLTDKPTVDSINTVAEWFFAGFTRVTGTETKAEERSDVYDVGLEMGRAKPALGRAGPGYWAGWVMKIVEP